MVKDFSRCSVAVSSLPLCCAQRDERIEFIDFSRGHQFVQRERAQIIAVITQELDAPRRYIAKPQRRIHLREEIDGGKGGFRGDAWARFSFIDRRRM